MESFFDLSRKTISEFLQTVVFVDDAAYPFSPDNIPSSTDIVAPSRNALANERKIQAPAQRFKTHIISTKCLIESFAKCGLVCSVIQPNSEADISELVYPLSSRTDILVFDWQLFDDDGKASLSAIKNIIENDGGSRLRMMCVYTGEPDLDAISKSLQESIPGLIVLDEKRLVFQKQQSFLIVLAKGGTKVRQDYADNVVDELCLPDKLIDCFSGLTRGLLSNAVIASLAGIRQNSYRLIGRFDKDQDYSYVAHRMMSNPVDDSEGGLLSLVASEMESVVFQSSASRCISKETVKQWVDSCVVSGVDNSLLKIQTRDSAVDVIKYFVENGFPEDKGGLSGDVLQAYKTIKDEATVRDSKLTRALGCSQSTDADRSFALLSTIVTRYGDYIPHLSLGSVVSDGDNYLLCIMPPCDSVRINESGRSFIFIKLQRPSVSNKSISIILKDGNDFVELAVKANPYEPVVHFFKPNPGKTKIVATKNSDNELFFTTSLPTVSTPSSTIPGDVFSPVRLRWIADVKRQFAQMFANSYASNVSRVGVSQSEWLRQLKWKEN